MSSSDAFPFQKFNYRDRDDLLADLQAKGIKWPVSDDTAILAEPLRIGNGSCPNRLAIHPMEGCDGDSEGNPGDLTRRRYRRFAAGGAGLIWVEATAVVPEGRANPRQLMLREKNSAAFAQLVSLIDSNSPHKPYKVLQLTHSGRYSRQGSHPEPLVAAHNPWLQRRGIVEKLLSDDYLDELIPAYISSSRLARQAGFDAVDIKSCHGYLICELLSAYTRQGRYGGDLEKRSRFLLSVLMKIRDAVDIDLAVRLNAYDEVPYPYGWGVSKEDHRIPDWEEPCRLVEKLADAGVVLLDVTAGNPYYNPHVNRPFDTGPYRPPLHQVFSADKLFQAAAQMRRVAPVKIIGTGFSWFRELAPQLAAGMITAGWFDLAGFGRQAFAYPQFAQDILHGGMQRSKCCIACGKCSEIMRDDGQTGCVIRDGEIYMPIYQQGRSGKAALTGTHEAEHV